MHEGGSLMPIHLPPITTVEGVVTRLLIAESRNPDFSQYDEAQVKRGMEAMKAVLHNRLHNHPKQFGAPNAVNYIDIITAPGQFHGFSKDALGDVVISPDVQQRINAVLKKANTGAPRRFVHFVENAINVAHGCINDPFAGVTNIGSVQVTGGGFGWRSAHSSDPGGRLIPIPVQMGGVIQGNKFYALKK